MANQQLVDYVESQRGLGFKDEEIGKALVDSGWNLEDVREVLPSVAGSNMPVSRNMKGFRQLFLESWAAYKARWGVYFLLGAAPQAIFVVLLGILGGSLGLFSLNESNYSESFIYNFVQGNSESVYYIFGLALFFVLLSFVLYSLSYLAITYLFQHRNENITWTQALSVSFSKLWGYLGVSLLMILPIVGGYVFLVVPGIVMAISFLLGSYVYIYENKSGMASLRRGRFLIDGFRLNVVAKLFFAGLVFMGVSIGLGIIEGIVKGSVSGLSSLIIQLVLQVLSYGVYLPMSGIFLAVIFENLRDIKANESQQEMELGWFTKVCMVVGGLVIVGALVGLGFTIIGLANEW